jgi:hypothetical protein
VFIFILSAGIFDSLWCIKELRAAIEARKKVVLVREYTFEFPEPFPEELKDIESILRNAPSVSWMAEYNSHCVDKLKSK